jgi:hypothetical protein
MVSSGMLRHVALVRTDVSEELSASIIRVTSVHLLLVTANVHSSSILVALTIEALSSSETSVLTRATWRNIPEDTNLHSHRRENLKSYTIVNIFSIQFHTTVTLLLEYHTAFLLLWFCCMCLHFNVCL